MREKHSKHVVVLTGAGISAESGLQTFRGAGGLWEGRSVMEVATPEAWRRDRDTVLRFYNERRRQLLKVEPNAAHRALVELERGCEVSIVTQNVDDLHERAGSKRVLHLHGELMKSRSTCDPSLIYDTEGGDIHLGHKCAKGSQLRPHVVWFGEPVEAMPEAVEIVGRADALLVIGTSLVVYPAAGLVECVPRGVPIYYVDPGADPARFAAARGVECIAENACDAVPRLVEKLSA